MSLLESRPIYKPFSYPWAYDAWLQQQQMHWNSDEVPLHDDIRQWNYSLNPSEKELLTQIFRFFTQADIDVAGCYIKYYIQLFKPVEIRMMLLAFANMETMHIRGYSYLLDSVGMPETEYQAFMEYKEMLDKHEFMEKLDVSSKSDIALILAVYGAFTEGLQLFASFAMLLNFERFGLMRGMCQIVAWSVRDETLHVESLIKLFHAFVNENPEVMTNELIDSIYDALQTIIKHEDAFIDLAFQIEGAVRGITSDDIKQYIRFIADLRLHQLGLDPVYGIEKNPLEWMDELLGAPEHVNFFENKVTAYARAATTGEWGDAFANIERFRQKKI